MSEIASQFTGLPMADLIGGPLQAACEAQVSLARGERDAERDIRKLPPGRGEDECSLPDRCQYAGTLD